MREQRCAAQLRLCQPSSISSTVLTSGWKTVPVPRRVCAKLGERSGHLEVTLIHPMKTAYITGDPPYSIRSYSPPRQGLKRTTKCGSCRALTAGREHTSKFRVSSGQRLLITVGRGVAVGRRQVPDAASAVKEA